VCVCVGVILCTMYYCYRRAVWLKYEPSITKTWPPVDDVRRVSSISLWKSLCGKWRERDR